MGISVPQVEAIGFASGELRDPETLRGIIRSYSDDKDLLNLTDLLPTVWTIAIRDNNLGILLLYANKRYEISKNALANSVEMYRNCMALGLGSNYRYLGNVSGNVEYDVDGQPNFFTTMKACNDSLIEIVGLEIGARLRLLPYHLDDSGGVWGYTSGDDYSPMFTVCIDISDRKS